MPLYSLKSTVYGEEVYPAEDKDKVQVATVVKLPGLVLSVVDTITENFSAQ
jgi:hypothetical protein